MSQPYYSDYSQQYYPPSSYDTTQSHTPAYNNYYNSGVTPSAHAVDDSSVLAQTYTYPNVNYAATTNDFSSYAPAPAPGHMGVPQLVPDQGWAGSVRYPEDMTAQPVDLHDQRRNSCASSTSGSDWYSQDGSNAEHYDHPQPAFVEQNHHASHQDHTFQHQHRSESMTFGMYSPTQYMRTQELARNAPSDPVNHLETVVPYGTLPIHEPRVPSERRPSVVYQTFDDGSVGHAHHTQFSPFIQSQPPSTESPAPQEEDSDSTVSHGRSDLFVQQRRAAGYQHDLQAQQELKFQLSGQFEQFEANLVNNQEYTHHHHPVHNRQSSSSSDHARLLPAPIVPSQARERIAPHVHTSPEAEEKKVSPSKKPALACLFCRKRKIACGPPSPDSTDRTCNQCARRGQVCEYPAESRRGVRKTQKVPDPEEPTVHKFVRGDAGSRGVGPARRGRRKRTAD